MQDNIFTKEKVIVGITKTTDAIRETYGAAGSNVILEEQMYPFHRITNDGKSIVEKVRLSDPVENIGANIIKEAGNKADKDSGDGRKTTMLLVEALFKEAQATEMQPMQLKRELDECVPIIFRSIEAQKKEITVDDIKSVASISAESELIGTKLQEIYKQIGKDGIVEVDNSNLPETFVEITEGVRLRNAGYFGAYSTTEEGKAVYKNPKILISKDKITSVDQLEGLFVALSGAGVNELVIYCDDIDMSVASMLAFTHLQGRFKTLLIKSPTLWKDWLFEDFAKITGATPVDSKNGKTFKNMSLTDLGTCTKIISTKDETRVIGIKDISDYIKELKDTNTDESLLRASWLNTKVAILKMGASSESELSYISKKANDACHASYLALKEGVVPGGGVALWNAAEVMPETTGGQILRKVLEKPIRQIVDNTGFTFSTIENLIGDQNGFDAKNCKMVNMFEAGILDPVLVIKNAVKNAVSIAGTILTSRGVIIIPREQKHENTPKMPVM